MSLRRSACVASAALLTLLCRGALIAQTPTAPSNGYTPKDDVEIGRQAAALVERRLPVLHDEAVTRYLMSVMRRLVAAIPPERQFPEFEYSVQVLNVREVNARALPGGPIRTSGGSPMTAAPPWPTSPRRRMLAPRTSRTRAWRAVRVEG